MAMALELAWRTQAGRRTADNRDCAGVGIRGDEALCILLDGSSRGPDSGALARGIASGLVDWFVDAGPPMTSEAIDARLHELHGTLSLRWPRASASYAVVLLAGTGDGAAIHAGDCLVGRPAGEGVAWLTRPDTLANAFKDLAIAAIAADPARHRLTRSFRAREFMPPSRVPIEGVQDLVLATDGFWADLSGAGQARFLAGDTLPRGDPDDDRSVLRARITASAAGSAPPVAGADGGLYVRIAGTQASA